MTVVGLRELRQHASALVRRVEAGEEVTITVAGRPSARLVPVTTDCWRAWGEVADLFDGPADDAWDEDLKRIDEEFVDPWDRR